MAAQGIRPRHVEQLLESNDALDWFMLPGKAVPYPKVGLYMKILNNTRPPCYLVGLVVVDEEGGEPLVQDVFRVPQKWLGPDPRPLQVLEKVCEEVGVEVRAGTKQGMLVLADRWPVAENVKIEELYSVLQLPDKTAGRFMVRVTSDNFAEVAAAYAIDLTKLKKKLGPK